jgi:hypothetical protein
MESLVPQARTAGFAMVDVLVALLLLAVVLTGACATLIQAMRSTHSALLTTRAVDLAADLTEGLRGVTSATQAEALWSAWRERVSTVLPVGGMDPEEFAALVALPRDGQAADAVSRRYELTLRWHEGRAGGLRELRLPVTVAVSGGSAMLPWRS